jgi:hypothetical protein
MRVVGNHNTHALPILQKIKKETSQVMSIAPITLTNSRILLIAYSEENQPRMYHHHRW